VMRLCYVRAKVIAKTKELSGEEERT